MTYSFCIEQKQPASVVEMGSQPKWIGLHYLFVECAYTTSNQKKSTEKVLFDKDVRCKDEEIDWAADYVRNMSLFAFFQILKEKQTLLGVGIQVFSV